LPHLYSCFILSWVQLATTLLTPELLHPQSGCG